MKVLKSEDLEELVKKHEKLISEILDELENKSNAGNDCNCDEKRRFYFIHVGAWPETMCVCLNCGGHIAAEF